jgi:hypothetical protein
LPQFTLFSLKRVREMQERILSVLFVVVADADAAAAAVVERSNDVQLHTRIESESERSLNEDM